MAAPRSSTRLVTLSLLIATAMLVLVSCSSGPQKPAPQVVQAPESNGPQTHMIEIRGLKFQPDILTVHAGDTVEWKNDDIVPHTVTTTESAEFDSGHLAVGASWKYVASKKGTYLYDCTLHPNMRAKLIVQ